MIVGTLDLPSCSHNVKNFEVCRENFFNKYKKLINKSIKLNAIDYSFYCDSYIGKRKWLYLHYKILRIRKLYNFQSSRVNFNFMGNSYRIIENLSKLGFMEELITLPHPKLIPEHLRNLIFTPKEEKVSRCA